MRERENPASEIARGHVLEDSLRIHSWKHLEVVIYLAHSIISVRKLVLRNPSAM